MPPIPSAAGATGRLDPRLHARSLQRRLPPAVHPRHARRLRLLHARPAPRTPSPACPGGSGCRLAVPRSSWSRSRSGCRRRGGRSTSAPWSIALLGRRQAVPRLRRRSACPSGRRSSRSACSLPTWATGTFTLMLALPAGQPAGRCSRWPIACRSRASSRWRARSSSRCCPRGTYRGERHRDLRRHAAGEHRRRRLLRRAAAARRPRDRRARRRGRQGQPGGAADGAAARRAADARGRAAGAERRWSSG